MVSELDLVIKAVTAGRKYKDVLAEEEASRDLRTRRANWVTQKIAEGAVPDSSPGEMNQKIKALFERAETEVV